MITQKQLKEVLDYNPDTGIFIWKVKTSHRIEIGDIAGTRSRRGYLTIGINGKRYLAHRLAFLFMTGYFPKAMVDHRNTNVIDNSWDNIREADRAQNNYNSSFKEVGKTGMKGVYLTRHGNFQVKMKIKSEMKYFGTFKDLELADLVATEARNKYHGEFANHGIRS